jgi:hypothetical protein
MLLNGREIITRGSTGGPMSYENRYTQSGSGGYASEALKGEIEPTKLSNLFFSKLNIDALHDGIRYKVYVKSGNQIVIGRQSETDLVIVMKGVFMERARYLHDDDIVTQVKALNEHVLRYVVPRIMTEIDMYRKYRNDVSTLAVPMDRPQIMTSKGSRQLERRSF